MRRRKSAPRIQPNWRVEMRPGAQAQVDWLQRQVWVDALGGLMKLWAFLMVLSASRMWAVVWGRRKDMPSWIGCHNEAFLRHEGGPLSVRPFN